MGALHPTSDFMYSFLAYGSVINVHDTMSGVVMRWFCNQCVLCCALSPLCSVYTRGLNGL